MPDLGHGEILGWKCHPSGMYIYRMPNFIEFILIVIAAFLLGSIPTAYLLVRRHSGKDLRNEGSGNIGTLNAFEVSRSKSVGIIVLLVDVLKGFGVTYLAGSISSESFIASSIAMLAVVVGHNYSPWIGWKGGRGLAAAAGASIAYNPLLLALWVVYWLLLFAKTRDVHIGNIGASILTPLTLLFTLDLFSSTSMFPVPEPLWMASVLWALFVLILLKHVGPMRDLWRAHVQKTSSPNNSGQQ